MEYMFTVAEELRVKCIVAFRYIGPLNSQVSDR